MKKLYKYLFKEFFYSFLLCLCVFTFMFLIFQIMELLELIVSKGVPFKQVSLLFIYILPSFLAITIPMAVLTSVFMTFSKLAQFNEITALKSAGISLVKIVKPVIFVSILLSFLMVFFNDKVLVWGNSNFRDMYFKIVYDRMQVAIKEKTFISDFPEHILYVEQFIPKTAKFKDIKIIKLESDKPKNVIFAESGELISDKQNMIMILKMYNGTIHHLSEKDVSRHYQIKFKEHRINLNLKNTLANRISSKNTSEMSLKELRNEINNPSNSQNKNILEVELQKKISIPFACFSFALIAAPLGVMIKKSGKSIGFGISLILIVIYYAILIAGVALGERGQLIPWLAIWSPNIVISLVGILLLFLSNRGGFLNVF